MKILFLCCCVVCTAAAVLCVQRHLRISQLVLSEGFRQEGR